MSLATRATRELAVSVGCPRCNAAAGEHCVDHVPMQTGGVHTGDVHRLVRDQVPHIERLRAALPGTLLGIEIVWQLDHYESLDTVDVLGVARRALGSGAFGVGHAWWGIVLTVRPSTSIGARGTWMAHIRRAYGIDFVGYGDTPTEAAADVRGRLARAAAIFSTVRSLERTSQPRRSASGDVDG